MVFGRGTQIQQMRLSFKNIDAETKHLQCCTSLTALNMPCSVPVLHQLSSLTSLHLAKLLRYQKLASKLKIDDCEGGIIMKLTHIASLSIHARAIDEKVLRATSNLVRASTLTPASSSVAPLLVHHIKLTWFEPSFFDDLKLTAELLGTRIRKLRLPASCKDDLGLVALLLNCTNLYRLEVCSSLCEKLLQHKLPTLRKLIIRDLVSFNTCVRCLRALCRTFLS